MLSSRQQARRPSTYIRQNLHTFSLHQKKLQQRIYGNIIVRHTLFRGVHDLNFFQEFIVQQSVSAVNSSKASTSTAEQPVNQQ
jgi:hypothetical protein